MSEFLGTSYFYKDKIIGVCRGLGEKFIVGYHGKNGYHRVVSPALPVCGTIGEAQEHLDKFAENKGLLRAKQEV